MSKKFNSGGIRGTTVPGYAASRTGLWSLDELRGIQNGPGYVDFSKVILQCHFDRGEFKAQNWGINYGSSPAKILRNSIIGGGVEPYLETAQFKWGTTANFNGNLMSEVDAASFAFGTGDWQIEGWFWHNGITTTQTLVDMRAAGINGFYPTIYITGSKKVNFYSNTGDRILGTTSLNAAGWHHFINSRVSGVVYLGLDGGQEGSSFADANNYTGTLSQVWIGVAAFAGAFATALYFDSIRISKGTLTTSYTGGAYTVPTYRFPTHG